MGRGGATTGGGGGGDQRRYYLHLWRDFIRNKPRYFSERLCKTCSRTRKRTLDTAEERDSVLDIPEKIDFEDSDKESEQNVRYI
ncbi:hypothetical protein AgCh_005879 [Apium graveolens]